MGEKRCVCLSGWGAGLLPERFVLIVKLVCLGTCLEVRSQGEGRGSDTMAAPDLQTDNAGRRVRFLFSAPIPCHVPAWGCPPPPHFPAARGTSLEKPQFQMGMSFKALFQNAENRNSSQNTTEALGKFSRKECAGKGWRRLLFGFFIFL